MSLWNWAWNRCIDCTILVVSCWIVLPILWTRPIRMTICFIMGYLMGRHYVTTEGPILTLVSETKSQNSLCLDGLERTVLESLQYRIGLYICSVSAKWKWVHNMITVSNFIRPARKDISRQVQTTQIILHIMMQLYQYSK